MRLHLTADCMQNNSGRSLASGHMSLTNGNSLRHTRPWECKNKPSRDLPCTSVSAVSMNNVPRVLCCHTFCHFRVTSCICCTRHDNKRKPFHLRSSLFCGVRWRVGPIRCPETSVNSYQSRPKERTSSDLTPGRCCTADGYYCCVLDRHCFFFSARLWYVLYASHNFISSC
jgi:hypothetical protein